MGDFFSKIPDMMIPAILLVVMAYGIYKKVPVFDVFLEGAKEGLFVAFRIVPPIVGILTAVAMFKASGALDLLTYAISPVTNLFGIPAEVVPLGILRPISGSGALGFLSELLNDFGPDSFIGRCASVMMGSTDTTFYTIAVYFSAIGIKKTGPTVPVALSADLTGFIMSILFVKMFFGW